MITDRSAASRISLSGRVPHGTVIKCVVAVVVLSQPFQYAFVARFGEPYPALMMPQFAGSMTDANGNVTIQTVQTKVIFADDEIDWVSTDKLLSLAPVSHRSSIMEYAFGLRPLTDPSAHSSSSFVARLKTSPIFPGFAAKYSRRAQTRADPPDPRTRDWLKMRLRELYPSRKAIAASFVWYQEFYSQTAPTDASRRLLGTYDVRLEDAR